MTQDTPTDRDSVERLAEKLEKAVAREMSRVCNEYAKDGNMTAATAIHDAWLCVQKTLRAALNEAEAENARLAAALRAAIDDISEYVGYSYADEYRAALQEKTND